MPGDAAHARRPAVARLRVVKTVWGHFAGGPGTSPEDIEVLERNLSELLAS